MVAADAAERGLPPPTIESTLVFVGTPGSARSPVPAPPMLPCARVPCPPRRRTAAKPSYTAPLTGRCRLGGAVRCLETGARFDTSFPPVSRPPPVPTNGANLPSVATLTAQGWSRARPRWATPCQAEGARPLSARPEAVRREHRRRKTSRGAGRIAREPNAERTVIFCFFLIFFLVVGVQLVT